MGIQVEKSVTIQKTPEELYRFWRNFENLPHFMNHLQSVQNLDGKRSHWVTTAPLGTKAEWDAEITEDQENQYIAWRSLEGSSIESTGSVSFRRTLEGDKTKVTVKMEYNPPGGMLGAVVANFFGEAPDQQLQEDLFRLKQELEVNKVLQGNY